MNQASATAPRWHLVILDGSLAGTRWSLTAPRTRLGRVAGNDLVLGDVTVSREHCTFVLEGETLRVEDSRSASGTWVNQTRIQDEPLRPGDVLRVGQIHLRVELGSGPGESA